MGKWEPYIIHDIILPIIMKGDLIHFTINTSGTGYAGDVLLPWLRRPDGALHTRVSTRLTLVLYQLGYFTLLQEHILESNPLLRGPAYTVAVVFTCIASLFSTDLHFEQLHVKSTATTSWPPW